jgi:hypothetical protein
MKKLPLIAFLLLIACNFPSKEGKIYTFKEVGWTMILPSQFKVLDTTRVKQLNEKGKDLMEKSAGTPVDISSTHTLITAKKGMQYFTATITPFDPRKDGEYAAANKSVKDLVYKTFSDQMPDATLDTASDGVKVSGLDFDRYRLSVALKGKPLFTMFLLSRLYKGYDFGMNYLYTDELSKAQLESILTSSKFE